MPQRKNNSQDSNRLKKVVVVGGGFAGVRTALDLARWQPPHTKIILISDTPHFEYHAALYRVVTGHSPLEVCIPLSEIFANSPVEVIEDEILAVDPATQKLTGSSGSTYTYDYVVLALGSQTAFLNIPGLKQYSFGLKSITQALTLKRHLHGLFKTCKLGSAQKKVCAAHVMVVGGGASGVEIAGQLSIYMKSLAHEHGVDESVVTIDLIEAAPRLLPFLHPLVSQKVKRRLDALGVNIFLNRTLIKQELEEVVLKDLEMKTKTLIWTAGTTIHPLYTKIKGLDFDRHGRVLVDSQLRAEPFQNVFVLGDAAATPYVGTASTALDQGKTMACAIFCFITQEPLPRYKPKKHWFSIPVGPGWAASGQGELVIYGRVGWWIRRYIDLRFFHSILPWKKAWLAFRSGRQLVESCPVCSTGENSTRSLE